jgi:hypothetical protein
LRHEADRTLRIWPETWEINDKSVAPKSKMRVPRLITKAETVCPNCGQKYQELLIYRFMPATSR